ncbi:Fc.00g072250.m01.CDS01 [Cosmosporella sp. VM-42]
MDSQPLLGQQGVNALRDHPAFLRASHSPWSFIPQNVLVTIRGLILLYLLIAAFFVGYYEIHERSDFSNFRHFFELANIALAFVIIYFLIVFGYTYTHLYYPNRDNIEGDFESWVINALSIPRNVASVRTQFYFTLFYALTFAFSFINAVIYFFITRRDGPDPVPPEESGAAGSNSDIFEAMEADMSMMPEEPFSDIFGKGWFRTFVILNLFLIPTLIMVFEILYLNSIRRPYAVGAHILGIMLFAAAYLGWAAIGQLLTGYYAFFWLNKDNVGSEEAVAAYCILFIVTSPVGFILMQGLIAIRESLTRSLSEARAIAAARLALDS